MIIWGAARREERLDLVDKRLHTIKGIFNRRFYTVVDILDRLHTIDTRLDVKVRSLDF